MDPTFVVTCTTLARSTPLNPCCRMKLFCLALLLASLPALAQTPQVVQTDSSRIETRQYPGGREVKEISTRRDRVYYRFYRDNAKQVTTTATYTKSGRPVGVTREYDDQGHFRYAIDQEKGKWITAHTAADPYYALRQQMKAKADRLIAAMYGPYFLQHQVIWDVAGSSMQTEAVGGNWTDTFGGRPIEFLLLYHVKLDAEHIYADLIQITLDSLGHYKPTLESDVWGFEKRSPRPTRGFALSYEAALASVRQKNTRNQQPLAGFLQWEQVKQMRLYPGYFRFYVPVLTRTLKDLHPQGRSTITEQYEVYVFNPWTGAFLEKKRMKSVRAWEKNSGFTSGLVPDEK